jgi:hypothetical protein
VSSPADRRAWRALLRRHRASALALLVFALAFWTLFARVLAADWTAAAALQRAPQELPEQERRLHALLAADLQWVTWLVGRNARVLLHDPGSLFDAGICHPAPRSLALGEPGIALGLVGLPAELLSGSPVANLNFAVWVVTWVAALAMFLLVRDWTGLAAAGVVAGLVFAFHPIKVHDFAHPYVWDSGWTVLALFFARRLAERGRWRDALGLAAGVSLQLAGSLYPLLSGAVLGAVLLPWLAAGASAAGRRPAPWALATLLCVGSGWLLLHPYLELARSGVLEARAWQAHLPWANLAPGGLRFPGWLLLLLAAAGLALGRRRCLAPGTWDPRAALVIASLILLLLATGGNARDVIAADFEGRETLPPLPNPYRWLAALVPGLAFVRAPLTLLGGVLLALALLAGMGAAGLLRCVPQRARSAASAALVALAFVAMLRPPALGLAPRAPYDPEPLAPSAEELAFFQALERKGNAGPLLELPMRSSNPAARSRRVFLSAYHGRRTSACYSSYQPPETREVQQLAARLPEPAAFARLAEMGFTTLIFHRTRGDSPHARLSALIEQRLRTGPLTLLHETPERAAYALPGPATGASLAPARAPSPRAGRRRRRRPSAASRRATGAAAAP